MSDPRPPVPGPVSAHARLRRFLKTLHEVDPREGLDSVLARVAEIVRLETGGDASAIVVRGDERGSELCHVAAAPPAESLAWSRVWSDGAPALGSEEAGPLYLGVGESGYAPLLASYARMGLRISRTLSAPLLRRGLRFGFLEVLSPRNDEWGTLEGLEIFETLVDEVSVLLDNALLLDHLRRERMENELLYSVSQKIALSLDSFEVLNSIIESLRHVVPYDAAAIFLLDARTLDVAEETVRGYRPETARRLRLKMGEGVVGWAAKTGQSVIVPDVRIDPRYVAAREQTRAEMVAPLKAGGEVIGVFNLESDRVNAYTPRELRLLETFASQVAITIERSRYIRQQVEKERLDRELQIARRIQLTFLPERDPDWPGFDVSGYNVTSEEVSGDFFDYIPITGPNWGVVVADVSGKGVPASLIMASLRAALWAEVRNTYSLATICSRVNNFLYQSLGETEFVTAVYGVIDLENGRFTYSSAGHLPPILLRRDGAPVFLEEGGLPLGAFPDVSYPEGHADLKVGDVMLLYTDGAVEAMNAEEDEFGRDRLVEALRAVRDRPAREIRTELIETIRRFSGSSRLADDLTLVVIKRPGSRKK